MRVLAGQPASRPPGQVPIALGLHGVGLCRRAGNHHCLGPLTGKTPWTADDLLLMIRIAERLAVLYPKRAGHWYETAVNWRIWARDVEARRRWWVDPPYQWGRWLLSPPMQYQVGGHHDETAQP